MAIKDSIKNFMGFNDGDDDFIEDEGFEVERDYDKSRNRSFLRDRESNVVPMQQGGNRSMKLMVIEPASFEEAPRLVDSLKDRKPVILNLESLDQDVARKIFDFLSGAIYALNGNIQKIANNIFVFAPDNVDISADDRINDFEFRDL